MHCNLTDYSNCAIKDGNKLVNVNYYITYDSKYIYTDNGCLCNYTGT